jgi:hypothetical protein
MEMCLAVTACLRAGQTMWWVAGYSEDPSRRERLPPTAAGGARPRAAYAPLPGVKVGRSAEFLFCL